MSPIIEKPTSDDIVALATLFSADLEALRIPWELPTLEEVATGLVHDDDKNSFVRVARFSQTEPALGVIVAHEWTSVKFSGRAFWLETLYVDVPMRRHGLGRRMVNVLIEEAKKRGCKGIDLEAYKMNAPASYLYRSLGFRRLGRERYSLRV